MKYEAKQKSRANKAQQWIKDCAEYWFSKVDESDTGVDHIDATTNCWRCGCLRKLQKCHIIPVSLKGEETPENIIPLCAECHDEMPNVRDEKEVWKWIKSDHVSMYETFWAYRAIKKIDLKDIELHIKNSDNPDAVQAFFFERVKFNYKNTSPHFNQSSGGCRITNATREWIIRKAISETIEDSPATAKVCPETATLKKETGACGP